MKTGIYKIENLINKKCYIGSTSCKRGFQRRWWLHKYMLKGNYHHSIVLQRAWNKYGEKNFIFKILEECEPTKCVLREQYYMDKVKPEYNICPIAGSSLGCKQTEETKKKISKAVSKEKNPFWKKTHTKEMREYISSFNRGEKNPNYGKKYSTEFKNMMSVMQSGKNNSFYGKHHTEKTKEKARKTKEKRIKERKQLL